MPVTRSTTNNAKEVNNILTTSPTTSQPKVVPDDNGNKNVHDNLMASETEIVLDEVPVIPTDVISFEKGKQIIASYGLNLRELRLLARNIVAYSNNYSKVDLLDKIIDGAINAEWTEDHLMTFEQSLIQLADQYFPFDWQEPQKCMQNSCWNVLGFS